MTSPSAPRSKSELIARARQEARLSLGRAAFVRDARVLPIGVPIALGVASLVYSRAAGSRHAWHWPGRSPIRRRRRDATPAIAATAALVGAIAVAYVGARVEWELRRRAHRAASDR